MNMVPSFTTLRSFLSYQFTVLRMRALRDRFSAKLSGAQSELKRFPGSGGQPLSPTRRLLGLKTIRVDQITGALYRNTDFDHQFRPLKNHVLNRWVNAYILHERDGLSPITVHKVDDQYFVEDGHHRVSVARALGMDFMEATVWEHSTRSQPWSVCPATKCTEKSSAKVYVTG
jgi:hypothetical protein